MTSTEPNVPNEPQQVEPAEQPTVEPGQTAPEPAAQPKADGTD